MAIAHTLERLVIQDSAPRGGRPIIVGAGVTVLTVVGYYKLGMIPEEIADEIQIALPDVYRTLTCYHLNGEETEANIRANSEETVMKSLAVTERIRLYLKEDTINRALITGLRARNVGVLTALCLTPRSVQLEPFPTGRSFTISWALSNNWRCLSCRF